MLKNKVVIEIWTRGYGFVSKLRPFIQSYWKDALIAGMTSTCLNTRSTMPGHASDKPTDCPDIDNLPDLNQGVGELLDCAGWVWKPPNVLIHGVLDGVQVWRTCWPVICVNSPIPQKSLAHSCHVRSGIVVYQEKPRADWKIIGPPNNMSKDLVSVPCTYQNTTLKHMQVRTSF